MSTTTHRPHQSGMDLDDAEITRIFQQLPSVVTRPGYTYCHTYEDGERRLVIHTLTDESHSEIERLARTLGFNSHSDEEYRAAYIFTSHL